MAEWTIYHNPRCSKSRATMEILQEKGVDPEVIEYLQAPLSKESLQTLSKQLGKPIKDFMRTKEAAFTGLETAGEEELMEAIIKAPVLLERPIVVRGDKAVLGRPPENVLDLF